MNLPSTVNVGDGVYQAYRALIHTRDASGRAKLVTLLHYDEVVELAGGEEIVWVYGPPRLLNRKFNEPH